MDSGICFFPLGFLSMKGISLKRVRNLREAKDHMYTPEADTESNVRLFSSIRFDSVELGRTEPMYPNSALPRNRSVTSRALPINFIDLTDSFQFDFLFDQMNNSRSPVELPLGDTTT
jgi:hypothetical protein